MAGSAEPDGYRRRHGRHSTLYVDSAPLLRNPATPSNGLATAGKPWLLGANHYANVIEQAFAGHLGELRIVTRALKPSQFLNA
ncbi:hypothetical protein ACXC9Q_35295 [Kribbella sp. CWNU-51]